MKTPHRIAAALAAVTLTATLYAQKDSDKAAPPKKENSVPTEAGIRNDLKSIEKELQAARKKTLDAIAKQEASKKELEAGKQTARALQDKAAQLAKSLEAVREAKMNTGMQALRQSAGRAEDKGIPNEIKEASSALDSLRIQMDQTYGADQLAEELAKSKAKLATTESEREKAREVARKAIEKVRENVKKLNETKRELESTQKTVSTLQKESKADKEALAKAEETLKERDSQIKKLRETPRRGRAERQPRTRTQEPAKPAAEAKSSPAADKKPKPAAEKPADSEAKKQAENN